jgi:hypothetical protein
MITVEQLNALADAVGDCWRCLVEMAAWCGLRFGELAALRKNRIDIEGGLCLSQSLQRFFPGECAMWAHLSPMLVVERSRSRPISSRT